MTRPQTPTTAGKPIQAITLRIIGLERVANYRKLGAAPIAVFRQQLEPTFRLQATVTAFVLD